MAWCGAGQTVHGQALPAAQFSQEEAASLQRIAHAVVLGTPHPLVARHAPAPSPMRCTVRCTCAVVPGMPCGTRGIHECTQHATHTAQYDAWAQLGLNSPHLPYTCAPTVSRARRMRRPGVDGSRRETWARPRPAAGGH